MGKYIKKVISIQVGITLFLQQTLLAGGLVVDKNAPKQNQANLENSRNGVPVVNIVAPNQSGLSHNKFSDYNVNKEGLILNNSNKREVNTQLAGYIYGNENLRNGTAKTILNEVTSKNKTHLKGFTEVAGDRANVVVANPNGIYINGAGFINTSRATITTGNPNINNQSLVGFEVRGGQIDIDGDGLNLSNVNKAELYAQTVKLSAKISAQNLDIVTGKNSISNDGAITNIENPTDEKPTLALDSSALGGIYANKINLIGTQKGVGVNLPIEITAQDDFTLTADGKIVLNKVVSEKNIKIKSNSDDINTNVVYANSVNIEAKKSITNEDTIASKTNIDLEAKSIVNNNLIMAGVDKELKDSSNGDLTINSEGLENKKTLYAKDSSDINSMDIKSSKESNIVAKKDITIKAKDIEIDEGTTIQAGNNLKLTINEAMTLDKGSSFLAQNSLVLNTKSLINNAKLISNGDLIINTEDFIVNNSLLSSKNIISLNATNYIQNNDSNEKEFGIKGAFTNLNTKTLTNYGFISSLYDMNLKTTDLINYGGILSANSENVASNMNIQSDNFINYNTIYSNDNVNLYIKNRLNNITNNSVVNLGNEKATIFAKNNITIQGDKDKTLRTDEIINQSANIQTQDGDISIFANNLVNKRSQNYEDLYTISYANEDYRYIKKQDPVSPRVRDIMYYGGDIFYYVYYPEYNLKVYLSRVYSNGLEGMSVKIKEVKKKEEITSQESLLFSGNSINIDSNNLVNEMSSITSKKDITFSNTNMNLLNRGLRFSTQLEFFSFLGAFDWDGNHNFYKIDTGELLMESVATRPNYKYTYDSEIYDSAIQAGGSISGNINKLQNGVIEGDILEDKVYVPTKSTKGQISDLMLEDIKNKPILNDYVLPTNKYGMFVLANPNKNLDYLVESNPLYTNYSNFVGSSYFIEKMDYKADKKTKRLGDAAYETKLVSDAIFKQTGERFLNPDYSNENEQFIALMDNAVNLSGILDLEFGKALSKEQIANLTKDIVWMEEKIIDGKLVLVPVVYLVKDYEKLNGASIVANKTIDLNIKDSLNNSGTIKSNENMNIGANSIINNQGVLLSNGKATLVSNDDFINKNGSLIKASDVQIASLSGSVINETFSKQNNIHFGVSDFTYTQIGKTSSIEATNGNLVIQAKNDITNIGASLVAKDSVFLQTQDGDINLKAIELKNESNIYFSGGFSKALDVEYQTSNIDANNILMQSGKNINIEASKLNADNQINLNAQNDVNILALNDVYYRDTQTTKKGFMSKKTQRDMVYKESVDSAELNANDIVINAQNDVNLEATKLKAKDNIIVNAKDGDVNIVAKEYREGELHETSKSSFGGLKKSLDISSTDALKLNSALLQTQAANVVLTSGKDINILASEINSAGDIELKALNDVLIASQSEYLKTREVHEKSSFNIGGLAGLVGGNQSIYSKEVTKNDKLSSTSVSSNLSANKNIVVDSGSTTIIGSNLEGNNISIKADTGEINILSSQDVENSKYLNKKVDVGLIRGEKGFIQNVKDMVTGETKLKFEVGRLEMSEVDKSTQTTKNNSSSIVARENLILDSLSDINIQGSNLKADDNLVLNTKVGDINILNTTDIYNEDLKEKYLKASVSATVQNEFVETAQAVKSAIESAEQLKQTKDDYSNYKKEVKKLENTLLDLKQRYKAKEVGIDYSDIEDLGEFIDELKSQERFYVAAIAAATADLASKTVAIATQATAAGSSIWTWGFSVGMTLDVNGNKSHTTSSSQTSNASNLLAKNIYINTDEKLSTNTNVVGSNIIADDNLYINTTNLNVQASQDTSSSSNDSKSLNGSVSFTMYGGGGGTAGLGFGKSDSSNETLVNNNSNVFANNININASNDAIFKGATLRAEDILNLNVGNNLVLESLRDEYSSKSKGFNVNAGVGFGSAGAKTHRVPSLDVGKMSSVNSGVSMNNSVSLDKQTVLSSITGNQVNVNVGNNTHLKGSLLASGNYDKDGNFIDNKNLNFTTDTLTFANSSNSSYSSNKSIGTNLNHNLEDTKIEYGKEKEQQKGLSSVGYQASNSLSANASKTLATLGEGNVTIKDIENSDELDRLNRDTTAINKDLYSSKTGTSVDATLDTRLLTKEGQEQIKKEYENLNNNMTLIAGTLPDANSDNLIEATAGEIWKWLAMGTLDILPSNENNGGVLRNIPVWFGEPDKLYVITGDEGVSKVYINGILNSQQDAIQGGKNIIGDVPYRVLYNPTSGILGDLVEAAIDKWGNSIGMQTGISKLTQEFLNNNKYLEVYLHSQGHLISKEGAKTSNGNGHIYNSYGAPMSNKELNSIFKINDPEKDIRKNPGDYVSYPLNIFNPFTWNKPGHGTENYKPQK